MTAYISQVVSELNNAIGGAWVRFLFGTSNYETSMRYMYHRLKYIWFVFLVLGVYLIYDSIYVLISMY